MDSTTFNKIADDATEYLAIGPFPAGDSIVDLTFILSTTEDVVATISPVLSLTGIAASADHQAGSPLISRSEVAINGIDAMDINVNASIAATVELKLDRGPLAGPTWVVVAVTNTPTATAELNVTLSGRSLGPER